LTPSNPRPPAARRRNRRLLVAVAVVLVGVLAFTFLRPRAHVQSLSLDEFERSVAEGTIDNATIKDRTHTIRGEFTSGEDYRVSFPAEYGDELTTLLRDNDVAVEVDQSREPLWLSLLISLVPILLLFGLIVFLMNSFSGGGGRLMSFGRSRARRHDDAATQVTFADVAGHDEAVEELREIRDFLADPDRFRSVGANVPKGVLLYGPPGTGKTLLARAVAGEAGAPFFSISGSDFVEMFVGVGASRVRDLFEQAKTAAPAIIFVDEIDAVGRHRGSGMGGGHDEREQTLNQLLVEMDGFTAQTGVILIAATNRPDILDPALLRPGRFDRQILVDPPDLVGRRAILEVHAKGKPIDDDVSLDVLARRTPGFTGADLANLLNEAALLAVRRGRTSVSMKECEDSIDRVMAGPERRTRVLSEHDKSVIAHHESGHALVGHVLAGTDPIHKVSIVSRGRALGWTLALPTEDRVLRTRSQLVDELAMLLGGRSAEEIVFGDITTGAQDDIERATRIARSMVTSWGMSEVLGPRAVGSADALPGADGAHGDQLASAVDDEVRRLIDAAHERAHRVINANRATLDLLAATLVERESLDEQELEDLFAGAADPGHPAPAPRPAPVEPPVAVATEPVRAPVVAATRATRRAGWRGRVDAWRHGRDIPKGLA
jgi:cell division protease FtsH